VTAANKKITVLMPRFRSFASVTGSVENGWLSDSQLRELENDVRAGRTMPEDLALMVLRQLRDHY
jgi:hypothetical protein